MIPLWDTRSSGKFPFWVVVIISLNIFIFIQELFAPDPDAFIAKYALIPAMADFNSFDTFLPFLTSQFLHGGFLHIISNMWFLWIFGDNVEARLGFFFFPIAYLLSGVTGNILQYAFTPHSQIPIIGASGAIAGVLGVYFALFSSHRIKTLVPIFLFITTLDIPASLMLFYWFIAQLFNGAASIAASAGQVGGIAYFAHAGGFTTGWFIGKILFLHKT